MEIISVELTDYTIPNSSPSWWHRLLVLFLKPGMDFEVRCWREETAAIEAASRYGTISPKDSTEYEVSIKGTATESMIEMLLKQPDSRDPEILTPFFTINLGQVFSSSHYGKQNYFAKPDQRIVLQLHEIFDPLKDYFSIVSYVRHEK